jgi:hypothetical protein
MSQNQIKLRYSTQPVGRLEHDPEKWIPVSRLREALARLLILA